MAKPDETGTRDCDSNLAHLIAPSSVRQCLRLRGHPCRRVQCAVRVVAPDALHDFEKETIREACGVDVEILPGGGPIVENAQALQALDEVRVDVQPGQQVIVIVGRDGHKLDAVRPQPGDRRENVRTTQRDVVNASSTDGAYRARGTRPLTQGYVEDEADTAIFAGHTAAANQA